MSIMLLVLLSCRCQVTISCLINQISDLPPEQRRISMSTIAARTKLSIDGVEFLIMKALALHLIEGSIDQVGADCHFGLIWWPDAGLEQRKTSQVLWMPYVIKQVVVRVQQ